MNFVKNILITVSCFVLLFENVLCQFDEFPDFLNKFTSNLKVAHDPRLENGPVLFPQAPIPPDTSGVRVGASGFGFVPPGGQGRVVLGAVGAHPHVDDDFPFW